jgi:DNA-binding beta-propeller fold protein YncE
VGLALSPGSVWVTLAGTNTVRRYSRDGALLAEWGGSGDAPEQLSLEEGSGIAVLPSGNLLVADTFHHRIKEFAPDGTWVAEVGSGTAGTGNGQLSHPHAAALNPTGDILYVLDTINDRVQAFCLTSPAACAPLLDADSDGVPDPQDNCPQVPIAQPDTGSVSRPSDPAGAVGDGIGDACQCGALDADGDVDASDRGQLRLYLAGLAAVPAKRCSVAGGAECNLLDDVVLARAFAGQYPGARQVCAAAVP